MPERAFPSGFSTNQSASVSAAPPDAAKRACLRLGPSSDGLITLWEIELGKAAEDIAKGLFAALRELDKKNVDAIFVEGIDDSLGDVAAAVMNRLRKAAEIEVRD